MYYEILSNYGKAFVKTTEKACVIVKQPFDGPISLTRYTHSFRKQPDDVITEIDKREFERQVRQTFSLMTC